MSEPVYFLTLGLGMGTILLIFGMRHLSALLQARAKLANDDAYRQIATAAAQAQAETAAALADIKTRLASIEKVLKDVG